MWFVVLVSCNLWDDVTMCFVVWLSNSVQKDLLYWLVTSFSGPVSVSSGSAKAGDVYQQNSDGG